MKANQEIREKLVKALPNIAIELEAKLTENSPKATGRLMAGIRVVSTNEGLLITMPSYAYYTEYGLPAGTFPNIEALKEWCRIKLGDENLAWAVANHIKKYGTKPQYWIRDTMHLWIAKLIRKHING